MPLDDLGELVKVETADELLGQSASRTVGASPAPEKLRGESQEECPCVEHLL
ncbi:hypothetical protein ACFY0R_20240 [Streptomyces sp. NPDC001633]